MDSKKTKVLIISYFFPNCSLTAAHRVGSWEKYLPTYGFYPIVITRNWTGKETSQKDRLKTSGDRLRIEKNEKSEIHYLPYSSSYRDRFFVKGEKNFVFMLLSKLLTLFGLIFQNFFLFPIPYKNIYFHAREVLKNDSEITYVLISVNPYEQLFFGYLLKLEFPHIKLIADYRDDWTTTELIKNRNLIQKFIHRIEVKSEKKWLKNYSLITTISKSYANKLKNFTGIRSEVILNGYEFGNIQINKESNPIDNNFKIVYNGSLYETQPIEGFLNGFKKAVKFYENKINIKLFFPGLKEDPTQAKRVADELKGFENSVEITERLPRTNVINLQNNADLLLMISHENIKGIPSSKLYEYVGLKKPVLLYPNDNDIIYETLTHTELGVICNNETEVFESIVNCVEQKNENDLVRYKTENIEFYSREKQAEQLAILLKSI